MGKTSRHVEKALSLSFKRHVPFLKEVSMTLRFGSPSQYSGA